MKKKKKRRHKKIQFNGDNKFQISRVYEASQALSVCVNFNDLAKKFEFPARRKINAHESVGASNGSVFI